MLNKAIQVTLLLAVSSAQVSAQLLPTDLIDPFEVTLEVVNTGQGQWLTGSGTVGCDWTHFGEYSLTGKPMGVGDKTPGWDSNDIADVSGTLCGFGTGTTREIVRAEMGFDGPGEGLAIRFQTDVNYNLPGYGVTEDSTLTTDGLGVARFRLNQYTQMDLHAFGGLSQGGNLRFLLALVNLAPDVLYAGQEWEAYILYDWELSIEKDGSSEIEISGLIDSIEGVFPPGGYEIRVLWSDHDGYYGLPNRPNIHNGHFTTWIADRTPPPPARPVLLGDFTGDEEFTIADLIAWYDNPIDANGDNVINPDAYGNDAMFVAYAIYNAGLLGEDCNANAYPDEYDIYVGVANGGEADDNGDGIPDSCPTPICPADWNADSVFNTADFVAYLNDYTAVDAGGTFTYADPDIAEPIGTLNTADFVEYLNRFTTGCP